MLPLHHFCYYTVAAMDASLCVSLCGIPISGWAYTWPQGGQGPTDQLPRILLQWLVLPWTMCVLPFGTSHETLLLNFYPMLLHNLWFQWGNIFWGKNPQILNSFSISFPLRSIGGVHFLFCPQNGSRLIVKTLLSIHWIFLFDSLLSKSPHWLLCSG